jgi:hypothetical protein
VQIVAGVSVAIAGQSRGPPTAAMASIRVDSTAGPWMMLAGSARAIPGLRLTAYCHCHITAPGAVKYRAGPMTATFDGTFVEPVFRLVSITVPDAVPSPCHTW